MARELDGWIIDEGDAGDEAVTIRLAPGFATAKVLSSGLFFVFSLGAAIALPIGLVSSGEWAAMAQPQRLISGFAAVAMLGASVMFGRYLFLGLDRSFALRADGGGLSLRRHRLSSVEIPREQIAAVHVSGRLFQPQAQARYCTVELELERSEGGALERLLVLDPVRDTPANRERQAAAGRALGQALARALDVRATWSEFSARSS